MRGDGFELDETTLATVLGSMGTWGIEFGCFVSHRLSVVNQMIEEKSVTNESQNRMIVVYSMVGMMWWWSKLVIGRTGGESREDATMVTVAGYCDVNTVEVNLVTTGGRENEKV
ncbi:hypothetical protein D8674_039401 [Pyrus ussuriensis x Pyrus communis]|uniref:Uncharacterized protein n=1 Tax=Pyrus ussuriensis x Pyrus communis TaxID=2448454 RepID=A0A5N5HD94_9ROSA|nr:hypothetical protein D8674_039401 [Pyrus ussuriensis x Pyrus communis]